MNKTRRLLTAIKDANDAFALWLGELLSWNAWPLLIIVVSAMGLVFHLNDTVVWLLTIQTGVDSAATKSLQNHVRAQDAIRDAQTSENIENVREMVAEVRRMQRAQIEMMAAAERRDKLAAKSNKMILTALEARADFYDFVVKGGALDDKPGAVASRPRSTRKTNGRANCKRS